MALLSSLTNRIFLASALLAILTIAIAIYVVNVRVTHAAEAELQRGLVQAAALVDQQHKARVADLTIVARLVADLPMLKAAVATDDPPTVEPLAQQYRGLANADLLVVTDRAGVRLAVVGTAADAAVREPQEAIRQALAGQACAMFWPHPAGILQVVTVPIAVGSAASDLLGTLSLGVLLDDRVAREFKAVTESEIAFAIDGTVKAATFPQADRPRLVGATGQKDLSRIRVGDDEYAALVRPLMLPAPEAGAAQATLAAAGQGRRAASGPVVMILRSRTERLRLLGTIHAALAVTALVAVLLATVLSYGVARTVTRPLGAITAGMREVAATGDLTAKIALAPGRWVDEDARLLASTFNSLTDSVAHFQREAAQRERLSALGRLSTVIAHEIRNPLMIIKAALRPLRSGTAEPAQVRESVGDVEDEVARLNRIVNDVLDFARPVRLELAEADLNALVAGAIAAASAGEGAGVIALVVDPALRPIVTDAERLRAVLINLLTNARQAVRAKIETGQQDATAEADVLVTISRPGPGRAAVTVRDRGTGMSAGDLARVFEPYFTTRRGGTGLGLPISRNIVEGLGGTIAISSRPGEGTEVRIELPAGAPAADGRPGSQSVVQER